MIRGLLVFLFLPVYTVLASLAAYPIARCLGSPAFLYRVARVGMRIMLCLSGTRIEVEGRERLCDTRNLLIVSNHLTHLDAPVLALTIPADFKAVAKTEIFRFPFFHRCLRFAGIIEVDRSDPQQSRAAMGRVVASLKSGSCFLVFPEGTRSRTGELGPFKKGAFVAAAEAGSRIVPVALVGIRQLLPRGSFRMTPGTVRVRVLDPVQAGGYSYDQRDELTAQVRDRIAAALAEAGEGVTHGAEGGSGGA
jgi:1-acyl-sn-glycerol-3-phosphate acyltransferase